MTKTTAYLEEFLKVLLYGYEIELKNRFLRIGFEHGSKGAEAVQVNDYAATNSATHVNGWLALRNLFCR